MVIKKKITNKIPITGRKTKITIFEMKAIIEIIINKILRFKRFTRAIDKKNILFRWFVYTSVVMKINFQI